MYVVAHVVDLADRGDGRSDDDCPPIVILARWPPHIWAMLPRNQIRAHQSNGDAGKVCHRFIHIDHFPYYPYGHMPAFQIYMLLMG